MVAWLYVVGKILKNSKNSLDKYGNIQGTPLIPNHKTNKLRELTAGTDIDKKIKGESVQWTLVNKHTESEVLERYFVEKKALQEATV